MSSLLSDGNPRVPVAVVTPGPHGLLSRKGKDAGKYVGAMRVRGAVGRYSRAQRYAGATEGWEYEGVR